MDYVFPSVAANVEQLEEEEGSILSFCYPTTLFVVGLRGEGLTMLEIQAPAEHPVSHN